MVFFKQPSNEIQLRKHATSHSRRREATKVEQDPFYYLLTADAVISRCPSYNWFLTVHVIAPSYYRASATLHNKTIFYKESNQQTASLNIRQIFPSLERMPLPLHLDVPDRKPSE